MDDIKLIAIDLDGTLFNEHKEISKANQMALQAAVDRDIKIVICTGRTLQGVESIIPLLPLSQQDEYLILNNGASLLSLPDKELIHAFYLTREVKKQVYDFFHNFNFQSIQLTAFDLDQYYLLGDEAPSSWVQLESDLLNMPIVHIDKETFLMKDMLKIVLISEPNHIDYFVETMPESLKVQGNFIRSLDFLIEFLPHAVSKGKSLEKLAEIINISPNQVMAIGDERNDISMLEYAGISVAMANAHPDVKKVASHQTDSNHQDGVAKIIHRLLNNVNE